MTEASPDEEAIKRRCAELLLYGYKESIDEEVRKFPRSAQALVKCLERLEKRFRQDSAKELIAAMYSFDEVTNWCKQLLDEQVQTGLMSPEAAAKKLDWLKQTYDPPVHVTKPSPLELFAEQLKKRQGTFIPDFAALCREREDLDRKAFRPDQSQPGSPP